MAYICMVVDASYPKDVRVRKEAEALQKSGKNVLVVCPSYNNLKNENINGVEVYRLGKNYSNYKKGIFDVIESVFDINLFFLFGLKKVFKKYDIEFLHIHDLPLAGTGYFFRKKVKKIILDLHENYPEALQVWFKWNKNPLKRLKNSIFMNHKSWVKKEKKYCKLYDNVICVVEEMQRKIISNFDINSAKTLVISNQEERNFLVDSVDKGIINENDFSITYIGGIGPHRGIDTVIKSMRIISKEVPNVRFNIIGSGSKATMVYLKDLTREYEVEDHVVFMSYKPFNQIGAIMNQSKINIIPHNKSGHTDNTIPHKLFQIMLSKGMLLVSSCDPLKRIVETYNSGFVFEADNDVDLASVVVDIYNNYGQYEERIVNGYNAAIEKENWELESLKLIEFYDTIN
ncbi:conserved hypothetical protein [Tenacibaculum sp. 190524A05c]|uniref:glycosyltransferase n=1 Tax=Tenacibaculum platacis TaxID=3137852 RepID=UPI0031FAC490